MFLRSFLNVVENPRSLPSFLGVYSLLWLLWHYQFLLSFCTATGNVIDRLGNAIDTTANFQYITVLVVTTILFILYFSFQTFIKYSREHVDKLDREENNPLSELSEDSDMEQLVITLRALQKEIKISKENEKKAKIEVKNIMAKLMMVQAKLDETTADFEILKATKHTSV